MSTQHTPAPWTTDGAANTGDLDIVAPTGRIAMLDCEHRDIFNDEPESDEQRCSLEVLEANGRLIAAAPDLLAAAQCALADFEGILSEFDPEREHPAWETLAELRTVIAKATGGGQ